MNGREVNFSELTEAEKFIEDAPKTFSEFSEDKGEDKKTYKLITKLFSALFSTISPYNYDTADGLFKKEDLEVLEKIMKGDFFPKYIKISGHISFYCKYNSYKKIEVEKNKFRLLFNMCTLSEKNINNNFELGLFLEGSDKKDPSKQTIEECTKDEFDDAVIHFVMNI